MIQFAFTSFLNEVITYNVREMFFSNTQFSLIQHSDVLIFVFPLYIDSINSAFVVLHIKIDTVCFHQLLSRFSFFRSSIFTVKMYFKLHIVFINSALLCLLIELEKRGFENKNINVYCIINNGFYEGYSLLCRSFFIYLS